MPAMNVQCMMVKHNATIEAEKSQNHPSISLGRGNFGKRSIQSGKNIAVKDVMRERTREQERKSFG